VSSRPKHLQIGFIGPDHGLFANLFISMIEDKMICEEKVDLEEKPGSEVGNCEVYVLAGEQMR